MVLSPYMKSKSPRILVVEDDRSTRLLLGEALEEENHLSYLAEDGEAALALLKEHLKEIGLVLLDLSTPKLSPDELLRELRAMPGGESVPVVVVSGWSDVEERVLGLGVQGVIRKPIELDDLFEVAKKYAA